MNHKTDMQAELKRVASELRAYNPAADEYKGEHIHKVWAREIEAAIAGQSAGVPAGYALVPIEPTVEMKIAGDNAAFWCGEKWKAMLSAAPAPVSEPEQAFQARVKPWMLACFGAAIAADAVERNHRFFEEASELVQSCGMTASEAHQLVDYTWGRPVGEKSQEVGGVMVTLAALCLANGLDMHAAGEVELARISAPEMMAKIRAKQAAKPKHSPLPEARAAAPQTETALKDELASMTRMFHAACADLGLINEALGLDPEDGGADPILDAIEELKTKAGIGAEAAQRVPQAVIDALRFYANGHHYSIDDDHQQFDAVSGEPQNWLMSEKGDDCTMIEDGSIAKAALCGGVLGFEEPTQPVEGEVLCAAPSPDREQATLCEDGGKCGIGGYCGQCEKVRAASEPEQPSERGEQDCPHGVDDGACKQCYGEATNALFCDLKTDEEKANFFLSGRGYETGVIAKSIQNDVAMAYQRCVGYAKEFAASAPTLSADPCPFCPPGQVCRTPMCGRLSQPQAAEPKKSIGDFLDAPKLFTQVYCCAVFVRGWPSDMARSAAREAVDEFGDDPSKSVADLEAVLSEVLRTY